MMHINTHEAYKQLVDAGIKERAAETIIKVIDEARKSDFDKLATREDLKDARNELKIELTKEIGIVKEGIFEAKLTAAKFHAELKEEMAELKGKFGTMQWMMGFLLVICSGILSKLLFDA